MGRADSEGTGNLATAFATGFVVWVLTAVGLSMLRDVLMMQTSIYIAYQAAQPFIFVLPAAPAGFVTGVLLGNPHSCGRLSLGWFGASGVMLVLHFTLSGAPDAFVLCVLCMSALLSLGNISAVRGARLRSEKNWKHLAWLIFVIALLTAAYSAMGPISDALDPRWPIR